MRVRLTGTRSTYMKVHDPARLRQVRVEKGMSLRDVARWTDRTPSYLAKIERGEVRTVSPALARRIELLYGPPLRVTDFFTPVVHSTGKAVA